MKQDKVFEKVHYIKIDKNHVLQRIDNFLITYLKNIPKSKTYNIIRKGEVRVNKKRVKPDYKLALDDEIRIPPLIKVEQKTILPSQQQLDRLRQAIIVNDAELMAINKPSGLPVHGGTGLTGGAINLLRILFENSKFFELIHRLDKETSGCLLIAKSGEMLRKCQQAWQNGLVEKYYYCLVKGHWPKSLQKVTVPLQKQTLQSGERRVRVDQAGKFAVTYFKPIQYLDNATLLEVKLGTGRTHQIRVHAAYAGHPIAGDQKYGNEKFNEELKQLGLTRLFLHAYRIVLPKNLGDKYDICVELPKELQDVIKKIM